MKPLRILALTAVLGLASAAALHADDTPTTKPARATKGPRVVKPFSGLTDLTFEQKTKIAAIHKQAVADKKKMDEKEQADCMALLTPEQKDAVEKMMDEQAAGRKKPAKSDAAPTTEPAGM